MPDVKDKNNQPIRQGGTVWTRIRGGRHEGDVDCVVTSNGDAAAEHVKSPPKVIYHDQHGHRVSHNPETLEHVEGGGK